MSKKLFHGSCHCGKIKFETNIDLSVGSSKCNCTFCRKYSNWNIKVSPENFKLLEGDDSITKYANRSEIGYYAFCKHCGSLPFGLSKKTDWTDEGASIKVSSFDDMSIAEMNSMPMTYYNGLDNTWSLITDPEIIKTLY
jgi:hypothetical protein